jgi:hypothetical protein
VGPQGRARLPHRSADRDPGREHLDTADAVQYALVVIRFLQPSTQAHTAQPHALWRPREHPVADTSQARQIDCQA